jgi:hypothetical protein
MCVQRTVSILIHVIVLVLVTYEFHPVSQVYKRVSARMRTAYAPHQSGAVPPQRKPEVAMKQDGPSLGVAVDQKGEKYVSVAVFPPPNPDLSACPHDTKPIANLQITFVPLRARLGARPETALRKT